MKKIQWDSLYSVNDYAKVLDAILVYTTDAVENGVNKDRLDAKTLLDRFVKESPVSCEFLDLIARRAATDIFEREARLALNAIAERSNELNAAINGLNAVTEEANSSRRSIMLVSLNEGLSRIEKTLQIIKKTEEALDQPDAGLLEQFATLKTTIVALKKFEK